MDGVKEEPEPPPPLLPPNAPAIDLVDWAILAAALVMAPAAVAIMTAEPAIPAAEETTDPELICMDPEMMLAARLGRRKTRRAITRDPMAVAIAASTVP